MKITDGHGVERGKRKGKRFSRKEDSCFFPGTRTRNEATEDSDRNYQQVQKFTSPTIGSACLIFKTPYGYYINTVIAPVGVRADRRKYHKE